MNELIRRRLKAARQKLTLTQAELSERLGFRDRQTLAAIEAGQRKISAEELLRAMEVLGVDLDYLTDSFRLVDEGAFSWRSSKSITPKLLDKFEDQAGRWIATFRRLSELQGVKPKVLQPRLALTERSSYEKAQAVAEGLGREWDLGEVPALRLERAVRERVGALVLYVDAPPGISGAACQVEELSVILINREEPEGRRHYDLAHECFHVLTWEQMPPERADTEASPGGKHKRIEQLANNFAAALLMPEHSLTPRWENRGKREIHSWLNETATTLLVTAQALKWRLVQLGWLRKSDLVQIRDDKLTANGRPKKEQPKPLLFSAEFVERVHTALAKGQLSLRRTASLLDATMEDLADLFRSYGLTVPFDV